MQKPWGKSQIRFLPLPNHSPGVTGADFLKHMEPLPRPLESLLAPSCRGPKPLILAFQALPRVFPLYMPCLLKPGSCFPFHSESPGSCFRWLESHSFPESLIPPWSPMTHPSRPSSEIACPVGPLPFLLSGGGGSLLRGLMASADAGIRLNLNPDLSVAVQPGTSYLNSESWLMGTVITIRDRTSWGDEIVHPKYIALCLAHSKPSLSVPCQCNGHTFHSYLFVSISPNSMSLEREGVLFI